MMSASATVSSLDERSSAHHVRSLHSMTALVKVSVKYDKARPASILNASSEAVHAFDKVAAQYLEADRQATWDLFFD